MAALNPRAGVVFGAAGTVPVLREISADLDLAGNSICGSLHTIGNADEIANLVSDQNDIGARFNHETICEFRFLDRRDTAHGLVSRDALSLIANPLMFDPAIGPKRRATDGRGCAVDHGLLRAIKCDGVSPEAVEITILDQCSATVGDEADQSI